MSRKKVMHSALGFILVGFLFYITSLSAYVATVFQDTFSNTQLNNSWSWQNPSGKSSYTSSNGTFNLTSAANNDQWININQAPKLLRTPPAADWTIETRITANSGSTQSLGGLTVYKDQSNWLLWGQLSNSSLEGSGLIGNAFTNPIAKMATKYNYLRLRKVSNNYYFDASADGINWNNANVYADTNNLLTGAKLGFMAKNWNTSSGYTMKFDYYKDDNTDLMPSVLSSQVTTVQVAKETGADSINHTDTVKICGTDLGEMFEWLGKTFVVYGDTNRCDGGSWPSNTMAYTTDSTPADGLSFDGWAGTTSFAKELFPEDAGNVTAIPTNGIGIGNNAYIYYMSVNNWNPPTPDKWTCSGSSIATATSTDIGTWTKQPGVKWGIGNFNVVSVFQQGTTLYIWGTPCGRFGSVKLMKVATNAILNKASYQYFTGITNGIPAWSSTEAQAVTVAGGPAGELSVQFNTWLNRYVMTYLDEYKGAIVLRESPNPWGPWSAPVTLASGAQYPQLYGAFLSPKYVENNGQSIYYMMSQFGPYNTYLMKSTLQLR